MDVMTQREAAVLIICHIPKLGFPLMDFTVTRSKYHFSILLSSFLDVGNV